VRIIIEQKCEPDIKGISPSHPDYDAYREGIIKVYRVSTRATVVGTKLEEIEDLNGITVSGEGDDYLREVKAEQLVSVLTGLGFAMEGAL
jgi:hypothetical protein